MCVATVTGFALVSVPEYRFVCLVPRARLMHRRNDGGEVAWPGILARAKLLLHAAVGKEQHIKLCCSKKIFCISYRNKKLWGTAGGRHLSSFKSSSPYSEASNDCELIIVSFIDAKLSLVPSGRNSDCIKFLWTNTASKLCACMCTRRRARARKHTRAHARTHTHMTYA